MTEGSTFNPKHHPIEAKCEAVLVTMRNPVLPHTLSKETGHVIQVLGLITADNYGKCVRTIMTPMHPTEATWVHTAIGGPRRPMM
jgi:hypothetical protein